LTKKIRFSYLWTCIFVVALLMSSYALFSQPREESSINLPDKAMHFFLFLTLSYLLAKSNDYFKFSLIFIIFYAFSSEIIQWFLPYREGDLIDLFFNLLGISVVFWKKNIFFSSS
tara:strand:+ start:620 stop:964 length:345 start_codon:yes stop_codon:yes gene_type:complete